MHGSSLCVCIHVPNVIPRDVIVRVVNILVVLVAIINELRCYFFAAFMFISFIYN